MLVRQEHDAHPRYFEGTVSDRAVGVNRSRSDRERLLQRQFTYGALKQHPVDN
jgi:hypothetical protein